MTDTNITIEYLGGPQIAQIGLSDQDILESVESALIAAGHQQTVIEPRMHLQPDASFNGHFNVLRGLSLIHI